MKKILAALAAAFLAAQAASAADSILTVNLFEGFSSETPFERLVVTNALGSTCAVQLPISFPSVPASVLDVWHDSLPAGCNLECAYSLCVGVGKSGYGKKPIPGASRDAGLMANYLQKAYSMLNCSGSTLVDEAATKETIRQGFAKAGNYFYDNATDYERCLFIFSISTHGGGNPAVMSAYDQDYLATELAEDLASLPEGVTSICIIDTCQAASMDPNQLPNAVLDAMARQGAKNGLSYGEARRNADSRVLFLGACATYEKSNTTKFLDEDCSAFTLALVRAASGFADYNGDLALDWGEVFQAAWQLVVTEQKKQTPCCSNYELAETLFAGPVQDFSVLPVLWFLPYTGEGDWVLWMPKLSYEYLVIDIAVTDCSAFPVTLSKFSSTTKTAKDGSRSSKGSFTLTMPLDLFPPALTAVGLVTINNQSLPCGELRNGSYKKGQLTYSACDDDGTTMGTVKVKINSKKDVVTIKGSFIQPPGYSQIADALAAFQPTSICSARGNASLAPIFVMTRLGNGILNDPWERVEIKDNGKTVKAKLVKQNVLM